MSGLLALLLVLLAAWPAHGAITFVQKVECTTNVDSCTTPSMTTTTGNLLVVPAGVCCASGVLALTDSKSNSWSVAATEVGYDFQFQQILYAAAGARGSSHTFTATVSPQHYVAIVALEISGAAASPLDQSAGLGESGAVSHTSTATPTTTQANELLIGAGSTYEACTFTTDTGAGWTEVSNITPASPPGIVVGRKAVAATGAYAYTYTTSANVRGSNVIATFKEAAAAGARQRCVGCGSDPKVIE